MPAKFDNYTRIAPQDLVSASWLEKGWESLPFRQKKIPKRTDQKTSNLVDQMLVKLSCNLVIFK